MLSYNLEALIQKIDIQHYNVDVLRLDKIDENISGNKWFKLKYHIQEAISCQATMLCTYGGVWSNHIAAFSSICKQYNLNNTIYVRSDEQLSTPTLEKAKQQGSIINYCTRAAYKTLKNNKGLVDQHYYIPEGGATEFGIKGAAEILEFTSLQQYDIILCSIGSGTTFAGLLTAALPHQQVIGINAVKAPFKPTAAIFLQKHNWSVLNDFHFGGFAKFDTTLINFMNQFYTETTIPTDIVYTGKLFFALQQMLATNEIYLKKKILVIHSGGLQGNASLLVNTLAWS